MSQTTTRSWRDALRGGRQSQIVARGKRSLQNLRPPRPVPPSPASGWLRRLIIATAVTVVAVEATNLLVADDPGYSLSVRTMWALLRVIGYLILLRAVRYGRAAARPFGLILAVTTVFAVFRLTEPRAGGVLPRADILIGAALLTGLSIAVVALLYRSDAVAAHLSSRPVRRHVPGWVLTARVAVLAYGTLVLVPLVVALGELVNPERRHSATQTVALLVIWGALFLIAGVITPFISFFVLMGHGWARGFVGAVSVLVLVAQPMLCYLVLGPDGLLRDGVPLVVTAAVALLALYRSRGADTWIRA